MAMNRSSYFEGKRRQAEIAAYGAPVVRTQYKGTCGCGCGTKFRGGGDGDLVKWFGKWVLVPHVRKALDATHLWTTRLDRAMSLIEADQHPRVRLSRPDAHFTATTMNKVQDYLTARKRRARKALIAKSVAANNQQKKG